LKLKLVTDSKHPGYTKLVDENDELISRYITSITWHCEAPGVSTVTVVIENVETHLEGDFIVNDVTKTTTTYRTKDKD
jgi:hypothetical protein